MAGETTPGAQGQNSETQPSTPAGETGGDTGNKPGQESGGETTPDFKTKYEEAISHSREWEKRAKANKDAAIELQQLKDAQKTEAEKQADRLAELEAENAEFKAKADRAKWAADIAETTGVPANLLRGSTFEDLEAHAQELQPHFAKNEDAEGQGESQESSSDKATAQAFGKAPKNGPQSVRAQIDAAVKAGDYDLAANLKASMLGMTN